MRANDLSQFTFSFRGKGAYMVSYTTPSRGDYWVAYVTDMPLIDATKNAEYATTTAIRQLRMLVRRTGCHYNKHGQLIWHL